MFLIMKTQLNLTPGNWKSEILNGLRFAFDSANVGYMVTLEQGIGYPIRIFGMAKHDGGDTTIPLYIEGCRSSIILTETDKVYLTNE